jgi:hypothetical protein
MENLILVVQLIFQIDFIDITPPECLMNSNMTINKALLKYGYSNSALARFLNTVMWMSY